MAMVVAGNLALLPRWLAAEPPQSSPHPAPAWLVFACELGHITVNAAFDNGDRPPKVMRVFGAAEIIIGR